MPKSNNSSQIAVIATRKRQPNPEKQQMQDRWIELDAALLHAIASLPSAPYVFQSQLQAYERYSEYFGNDGECMTLEEFIIKRDTLVVDIQDHLAQTTKARIETGGHSILCGVTITSEDLAAYQAIRDEVRSDVDPSSEQNVTRLLEFLTQMAVDHCPYQDQADTVGKEAMPKNGATAPTADIKAKPSRKPKQKDVRASAPIYKETLRGAHTMRGWAHTEIAFLELFFRDLREASANTGHLIMPDRHQVASAFNNFLGSRNDSGFKERTADMIDRYWKRSKEVKKFLNAAERDQNGYLPTITESDLMDYLRERASG